MLFLINFYRKQSKTSLPPASKQNWLFEQLGHEINAFKFIW